MKILLINAPREGEVAEYSAPEYLSYDFANYPPMGLLAIAADVDARHNLKVVDTVTKNMTIDDVIGYVKDFKPDVLGVSLVSRRLFPAYEVFRKTKEVLPETIIVAGGPHINDFPKRTMEGTPVDFVISGYAEKSFPQFIEALNQSNQSFELLEKIPGLYYRVNGEIRSNPDTEAPIVLDDMPFPKRELVDLNEYFTAADNEKMTTIYTSRGCPYKCTFCDVQDKTYHYRTSKSIVDEFEYIMSLGIREIHIFDDTFNMGRNRVIEMCEEILKRNLKVKWSARVRAHPFDREMMAIMKASGCVRLQCGVESLDPDSLKGMKKKITLDHIKNFFALCKEFEIETFGYFILGFPEETAEYRKSFYKEIKKLSPSYIQLTVLYPLPLTQIYYDLLENGVYSKDYWDDFFKEPTRDYNIPPFRPIELQNELSNMMDNAYRNFYLSPRFIINDLKRLTSFKMLMLKVKLAFKLLFVQTQKTS